LAGADVERDERAELVVLRRLVARATGSRMVELPRHCSNLWRGFVRLAGANTLADALPPCMVLLECVAHEINDPALARKLRKWNRGWAERWQLTKLLDAASGRAEQWQQIRNVYLIIQIDPD